MLTKFCDGDSLDTYAASEEWASVLGEKPIKAVERLIDESMLQRASLTCLLDHTFTAAELKSMLREKGIKVSGRKSEIIQRLIENDAPGMLALTKSVTVYECTDKGAQLAQGYLKEQRDRRLDVEQNSLAMLVKQDFMEAVRLMAHYESNQVFPRGLGIDWSNYDCRSAAESLGIIFQERPGILSGMNANRLEELRIAAGMIELWSDADAKRWLPADFETGIRFDAEIAARMLCFYAINLGRLKEYEDSDLDDFVTGVEISAIDDGRHCVECSQINGKTYSLGQVPELPFPKCTSEIGCRCMAIPITAIDDI